MSRLSLPNTRAFSKFPMPPCDFDQRTLMRAKRNSAVRRRRVANGLRPWVEEKGAPDRDRGEAAAAVRAVKELAAAARPAGGKARAVQRIGAIFPPQGPFTCSTPATRKPTAR